MKNQNYYIFNTIRFGALSLLLLIVPFLFEGNDFFIQGVMLVFGLLFGFLAYKSFRQKSYAGVFDEQHAPPNEATENEKIKFYQRLMYASMVAFPALAYITYEDITSFENQTIEYVSLWWPIKLSYDYFGYWGGVLFVPLLGIIVITAFLLVIRKIKWQHNRNNTVLIKRY